MGEHISIKNKQKNESQTELTQLKEKILVLKDGRQTSELSPTEKEELNQLNKRIELILNKETDPVEEETEAKRIEKLNKKWKAKKELFKLQEDSD